MDEHELRAALARHLSTDALLGAKSAPLRITAAARSARPAAPTALRPPPTAAGPTSQARNIAQPPARSGASSAPRTVAPAAPAVITPTVKSAPGRPDGRVALQNISAAELARREKLLRELNEQQVSVCRKCSLCETRTNTVFGVGHAGTRLVFVGEAPGADEDAQGIPFVGRAGGLLTQMIDAMGTSREDVFICNILKCRPPGNRNPAPNEVTACWPYLDKQLQIIQPEVIVSLGNPASQTLLRTSIGITRLRGNWHQYYTSGMPGMGPATMLMPTFHPAYLLRSPGEKGKAWADLQMVMKQLGLTAPPKKT